MSLRHTKKRQIKKKHIINNFLRKTKKKYLQRLKNNSCRPCVALHELTH